MATEKSLRDMEQRSVHYDQISFLIPKGGRRLLRAMGLKEKCTAADVIRRAVFARAGLERLPDKTMLEQLDAAETNAEATDALIACQRAEYMKKRPSLPDDLIIVPGTFAREEIAALEAVKEALTRQSMAGEYTIRISTDEYQAIQRLVSRLQCDDDI